MATGDDTTLPAGALHEVLYGLRPFDVPRGASVDDHREVRVRERVRPPAAGRHVPAWLRDVLLRGLRHDPSARWPSMTALLRRALRRGSARRRRS